MTSSEHTAEQTIDVTDGSKQSRFRFHYRVNTDDELIIREVYEQNYYLKDFVLGVLPEDGIVVDIGAHIGCFTILAAEKLKPRAIIAIEPAPPNFGYLSRNIEAAELSGIVRPVQLALWNAQNSLPLFMGEGNPGGSSLFQDKLILEETDIVKTQTVRCTTLDALLQDLGFGRETISVLKIDVEGAESRVLEGSLKALRRTAVVVGELHEALVPEKELLALLRDFVVEMSEPVSPVRLRSFWAVSKRLLRSDARQRFRQQAHAASLENTLWWLKHHISSLESERALLQANLAEAAHYAQTIEHASQRAEAYADSLEKLKAGWQIQLERASEYAESLEHARQEAETYARNLEAERVALEQTANLMQAHIVEAARYAQSLEQARQQAEAYARNMEVDRAEQRSVLQAQRAVFEQTITALQAQLAKAGQYARSLEQTRQQAEAYARTLEGERDKQLPAIETERSALRQAVEALQAQLAEAGRYAQSLERARQQAEVYARGLEAERDGFRQTVNALQVQLADRQQSVTNLQAQLKMITGSRGWRLLQFFRHIGSYFYGSR